MSHKDSPSQFGRRQNFTRSLSESSAHYFKRKLYPDKNQNQEEHVNLMTAEADTNQERKSARKSGDCIINISCNPRHCLKESKKRNINVSYYCIATCLFCIFMALSMFAILLFICYLEDNDKQHNRLL